ncbi:MAG: hypothetical protein IJ597_07010, partial [Synergistaceae bacterium]|nr:hypothetical protein [Synergistaceae bacterium]
MKKVLCAFFLTLALSAAAFADPFLLTRHFSGAEIKDGEANYDNAKFLHFQLQVADYDTPATQDHVDAEGTLTLSGGKYTYFDEKVDGTNHNFTLTADMEVGENLIYDIGEGFRGAANTGLNGVTATWTFPALEGLDGSNVIPTYLSTKSQTAVPYVKYNYDGDGKINSISWSIVNPSDTSKAISVDYKSRVRVRVRIKASNEDEEDSWLKNLSDNSNNLFDKKFDDPSVVLSGDINLNEVNEALDPTTVRYCEVQFYDRSKYDTEGDAGVLHYIWRFFRAEDDMLGEPYEDNPDNENKNQTETPHLWPMHYSRADLVDGEANYGNAEFERLKITVTTDNTEATQEQIDATGTLTLSGGKYTYSGEKVDGTSKTYDLKSNMKVGENLYYLTASDFLGDADIGLNGVTATWTFESDTVINGSGVIPEFSSTKEQLQNVVPYLKLTYDDSDKISAIDWAVVKSSDVKTPMSVNYNSRVRIRVFYKDDNKTTLKDKTDFTAGTTISGKIELDEDETIDPSKVQYFEFSFRNRAD